MLNNFAVYSSGKATEITTFNESKYNHGNQCPAFKRKHPKAYNKYNKTIDSILKRLIYDIGIRKGIL